MKRIILAISVITTQICFAQDTIKERSGPTLSESSGEVLKNAAVMPEFPGGINNLYNFLTKNLVYPKDAKVIEEPGTVYVGFIVMEDGSLTDI